MILRRDELTLYSLCAFLVTGFGAPFAIAGTYLLLGPILLSFFL